MICVDLFCCRDSVRDNLLLRLQKYSPREDKNPKEDFFTESLAFAYNNVPHLADRILDMILPEHLRDEIGASRTQSRYEIGRIDLEMTLKNGCRVFFEHKLWSKIHEGGGEEEDRTQLDNYLTIADEVDAYVILVCPDYLAYEDRIREHPRFIGDFRWWQIFEALKRFLGHRSKDMNLERTDTFIVESILRFMEVENLQPFRSYTTEDDRTLREYDDFRLNTRKFMDHIVKELTQAFDIKILGRRGEGRSGFHRRFRAKDLEGKISLWFSTERQDNWFICPTITVFVSREHEKDLENQEFYDEWDSNKQKTSYSKDQNIADDYFELPSEEQLKITISFFKKWFDFMVDKGLVEAKT